MLKRQGFTLVELLVVIAIIGILIAMLLPAVQAAREAARRMQCSNNLKQIGLASLNYESTYNRYPAAATAGDVQVTSAWGFGWGITLLPYVEQSGIYDMLDKDGSTCSGKDLGIIYGTYNAHNGEILRGVPFAFLTCPSSPSPNFVMVDWGVGSPGVLSPCYTAIAGSAEHSTAEELDGTGFVYGTQSQGGVMTRFEGSKINEVTDGTSNTIIVGEQSGYLYTPEGTEEATRSDYRHSFAAGTRKTWWDDRIFNCTTVLYRINHRDWNSTGIPNFGANIPIYSAHPGGAQVVKADGAVCFLKKDLDLQTLYNLCDRDDGNPIGEH